MAHQFTTSYTRDAIDLLHHYKKLGEQAIAQCPDEKLAVELDAQSNSMATIVKHLAGNMRSRWTDFLTTDGEKPDRMRDAEFEEPPETRAEIGAVWESGWTCVFDALEALQDELEGILRGAVVGLRDGTISTDGLDTFKLGYEFVRDEIGMRRDHLKRHAGHDDNVVIVKSAQSA